MKTLWFDSLLRSEMNNVPYDPKKYGRNRFKFLFWETTKDGPLLIAGSFDQHTELFAATRAAGLILPEKPTGAGLCQHGEVRDWFSVHYNVTTPDHFEQQITDTLGMG